MDYQSFKNAVIAKCAELGIAEYELFYQAGTSVSIDTFRHEINEFSASEEGGVCFRCIYNGKMGYASTEELSAAQAAAVVEKAVDNASVLESEEAVFLCEGGQEYETLDRAGMSSPPPTKWSQPLWQLKRSFMNTIPWSSTAVRSMC